MLMNVALAKTACVDLSHRALMVSASCGGILLEALFVLADFVKCGAACSHRKKGQRPGHTKNARCKGVLPQASVMPYHVLSPPTRPQ